MQLIGNMTGIISLGLLAWQDFRSRRIAWWLLPIVVAGLLAGGADVSVGTVVNNCALNLAFLSVQLVFVWVWMSWRSNRFVNIIDRQIGLGDVLFMVCLAPAFSIANFLLFYTAGLVCTLLVVVLVKLLRAQKDFLIPLAGALALPLIALCIVRAAHPAFDFYNDAWLLELFDSR